MKIKVKLMTTEDLVPGGDVDVLGRLFADESGIPGGYDTEWFNRYAGTMIDSQMEIYVAYEEKTSEAVGMVGLVFAPDIFAGDMVAYEAFWYIRKEDRGDGLGVAILEFAERAAKRRGANRIHMISLASLGPEVAELYLSKGYTELETIYHKHLTQ